MNHNSSSQRFVKYLKRFERLTSSKYTGKLRKNRIALKLIINITQTTLQTLFNPLWLHCRDFCFAVKTFQAPLRLKFGTIRSGRCSVVLRNSQHL